MEHSFVRQEKSSNRVSHMLLSSEFPGFGIDKIKKYHIWLSDFNRKNKEEKLQRENIRENLCSSTKYQLAHT